ncbi:MAG: transcription-repair coupling factor [Candidatus Eisenbacteria bacterium]|nr:transcription-repair coupling factor [Candidatus Eisenbacteria bacterium]
MAVLDRQKAIGPALIEAFGKAAALRELSRILLPDASASVREDAPAAGDPAPVGDRPAPPHLGLAGLKGSACTVASAYLARRAAEQGRGPLIFLTSTSASLDEAREDFAFLLSAERVVHFPPRGVVAYDSRIPPARTRAARIEALAALTRPAGEGPWIVLTTPDALFERVPGPGHFRRFVRPLEVGTRIDLDELIAFLVRLGYQSQTLVGEYGDFGRRGGILDIYSFGRENPVRIELDDDEIVSLREFDVFTQRSLEVLPAMTILPMWELLVDETDWARAERSGFLPREGPLHEHLQMIREEGSFEGLDWMSHGFGVPLDTLLAFAGSEALVVAEDPVLLEQQLHEAREELSGAAPDADDPLAPLYAAPEALFVLEGGLGELLGTHPVVYVGTGTAGPRERERRETDAARRERPPRGDGWSAGEQLHPPDPLEEDPAQHHGRSWREMLAHRMPHRGETEASLDESRDAGATQDAKREGEPEAPELGGTDEEPSDEQMMLETHLVDEGYHWRDEEETSLLLPYATRHLRLQTRRQERFGRNLEMTRTYITRLTREGLAVTILCDTSHHRDRLAELMHGVRADFTVGNLAGGFEVPELGFAVLTDHEIFQRLRRRRAGRRYSRGISLKELLAMKPGDFVVHIDHGIGTYLGIERLPVNGQLTDCMKIEYAGGDKLFIPVDQLNLVQKYAAEEGHRPSLSKLGTSQWAKTKARVKKSIKDMAEELLRLYALRKSRPGHAFPPDTVWQTEMEARFPYDETPDQLTAIRAVKEDMQAPTPMDRLICGDVGYGKTEVAIRAAFKAVMDGKQVAVLVPTTLLAQQHYETFTRRLEGYPIRIEMLSRFRPRKEMLAAIADMTAGKVDIAIGTHRLLQKDVAVKELGLLIIDEEQRFGVAHKERLKHLRTQVDVLTLTATPIPRTMHMTLMGARDMSTIRTPPRDRRPIQTEIVEFREDVIAYALMREADRGGQSFFVHNRVESIDAMANFVRRMVPHLRIAVAHGQMRERKLEDVMRKFLDREFDVLVSTMIIESGLDLPNVNTIIVNRTDTFGLAQLYQLRGRVGRSARRAYAYLLIPPQRVMTEDAMKRLKAIEEFEDLGSGFQLAMRDLEIRGAGNLLGAEQHGFIVNVGFDLYTRLLEEAVREVRGLPVEESVETRIVTDLEAYLPGSYVPDEPERMNLYKTLADARTLEAVEELAAEVCDRFGRMPVPAETLFELRRLRIRGTEAKIETLTMRAGRVELEMGRRLGRQDVRRLMSQMPVPVSFVTHGRHRVTADRTAVDGEMLIVARQVIDSLTGEGQG